MCVSILSYCIRLVHDRIGTSQFVPAYIRFTVGGEAYKSSHVVSFWNGVGDRFSVKL